MLRSLVAVVVRKSLSLMSLAVEKTDSSALLSISRLSIETSINIALAAIESCRESGCLSLLEQLNLALGHGTHYAASSEKLSPDQMRLFEETEAAAPTEY